MKTVIASAHSLICSFLGAALAAAIACLWLSCAATVSAALETNACLLLSQAQVDSQGVFLDQVVADGATLALPRVRLGDAPVFGQMVVLTRAQVATQVLATLPELGSNFLTGADRVRISRRSRLLPESEVKDLLLNRLQRDYVRDQGELELRLSRPWTAIRVPDEPLEMKIADVPSSGVSPNFIARFELRAGAEALGSWQAMLQARVWREIWVAVAPLKRGQILGGNDIARERRDILGLRDSLSSLPEDLSLVEVNDNLSIGAPLTARSIRPRPIVRRGDQVEALVRDGALSISLKVEVLEEGALGQTIRIRNPQSRRELRGKVQNEQTILVSL